MSDISIRIPATPDRLKYLEANAVDKHILSRLEDTMFKPVGVDLNDFHPNDVCLRLRLFEDNQATLVELKTIKTDVGYSDKKDSLGQGSYPDLEAKAESLGYEVWGKMAVKSTEYKLVITTNPVVILYQKIDPIGEFLKIETESAESLSELLKIFKVSESEKIERNAAVLLGEKLGLIKTHH